MKDYGLVSVIMPAYNCEAFISEAIQSVINQTYPNWELLIIDDASVDAGPEIMQSWRDQDSRIHFLRNKENKGTHHTRNKGIEASTGKFIAFLDADDRWKHDKLEKQLKLMDEENLSACFSSYDLIDENGNPANKKIEALPVMNYEKLLKANYVGNLTGMFDVSQLGKIYAPDIRKRQDWALWLEVIKAGGPMIGIKESLAYYRIRKGSISNNKIAMLKYNFSVYHKVLGYNFFNSCWRMLVFLREQFFVKSRQEKQL